MIDGCDGCDGCFDTGAEDDGLISARTCSSCSSCPDPGCDRESRQARRHRRQERRRRRAARRRRRGAGDRAETPGAPGPADTGHTSATLDTPLHRSHEHARHHHPLPTAPPPPTGPDPRPQVRWWSLPTHAGLLAIHAYRRWVSPRLPARCRYRPTCSAYGLDAVRAFGLMTGARLALARVRRCTRDVACGTPDPLVVA